jgi:GDP-L-fucose synthase
MSLNDRKIYIAGSNGMVGSAVGRKLSNNNYQSLISRNSDELDLIDQAAVEKFFRKENPDIVILAAAKVGGIVANDTFRAEFIYKNLMIEANVIDAAFRHNVEKLIFLGSSCIYPKLAPQPIKEEYLLTGPLESTNEPYAIAKIAGVKLCENYFRQYGCDFLSVMPTNLYGINDNFDLRTSHVIPAMVRKFHEAKTGGLDEVVLWGSGDPRREFLYVDDLAEAIVFVMENVNASSIYNEGISHLNIGCGIDIEIRELAGLVKETVGYDGAIRFDTSKPDGTPRKLLDVSRLEELGWSYKTTLVEGLAKTYDWFLRTQTGP